MKISTLKISASKVLALGGLCALLAGTGSVAFAQGYDHQDGSNGQSQNWRHGENSHNWQNQSYHGQYNHMNNHDNWVQDREYRQASQYRQANQNERRRLDRLHAVYAQDAASGNYGAAERAHQHAQAIRARLHNQHNGNH